MVLKEHNARLHEESKESGEMQQALRLHPALDGIQNAGN